MDIETVMTAWIWPPGAEPVDVDAGLINHTVGIAVRGRVVAILQRLNTDIFRAELHRDIEAITAHLAEKGLQTPRIVPTATGPLWHTTDDGDVWRVLTPVGDRTLHKIADPADATEAAALVARFHAATADLEHTFHFTRPGAHDTNAHFDRLRTALMLHRGHRLYDDVAALADTLMDAWDAWSGPTEDELPNRIIHGDLKISNVRFTGSEATALIDLDTLAHGTIDIELGDAMRSWCNPASENTSETAFDAGIFAAAMTGYASVPDVLTPAEWDAIVPGTERICIELAARFAWDALEESYFGFDPAYGGHGEHSLLRARGQASLAASVRGQRSTLDAIVASRR
jgi:Ser/Thr protein kinase RdoA (MazF antagonist)